MAHAIQIDATTTLNLPHALDAAETRYLQALKASLSRDDAVQVVAAPPNADPGAVGALFLALERPLVYATDGTASSERAASAMRASGCEVAVLASRRRACAGEEALGSSKSDFEVLRRAAGRKGEEVSMKRRKLDKCAYAQARRRADAADVVLLDARLLLDPRKRLTLPATSVVLFDDSVDVEGLARQLASVHVNDALLERADRECARLDRKASKLAGDCNKDYVKIAEGQATPPSIECGACGLKSVVDGAPEECRVPGDCRRAHHFLRRVRAFIKHLRKKRPTSSSKAFLLELAEMLSAETLAAFPRRLASLRNALASRGAGPRASALDEVCAFARLVTRVCGRRALILFGRAGGLRRTAVRPPVNCECHVRRGSRGSFVEVRAARGRFSDVTGRLARRRRARRGPARPHDGPGGPAPRSHASAELRHINRRCF